MRQSNNGTRQGGILSPMLYAFYVNELLQTVSELSVGCKLDGENVGIICFADDIALLAPSARGLQVMLDCAHEVLTRLCLSVNPSKSSYIVFGKRGRRNDYYDPSVRFGGTDHCQYLGVTISVISRWTWMSIDVLIIF